MRRNEAAAGGGGDHVKKGITDQTTAINQTPTQPTISPGGKGGGGKFAGVTSPLVALLTLSTSSAFSFSSLFFLSNSSFSSRSFRSFSSRSFRSFSSCSRLRSSSCKQRERGKRESRGGGSSFQTQLERNQRVRPNRQSKNENLQSGALGFIQEGSSCFL